MNVPQTYSLKQVIYYLAVFGGQKSRHIIAIFFVQGLIRLVCRGYDLI